MAIDSKHLSKTLSHALRHEPWLYEIELDDQGWASVESVLAALRLEREPWASLTVDDLIRAITQSDKRRYEYQDGKIRALYGHSIAGKLRKKRAEPPAV